MQKQAVRTAEVINFFQKEAINQIEQEILVNYQESVLGFFEKRGIILEKNREIPPTLLAVVLYDRISKLTKNPAPYWQIKQQSIQKARLIKETLRKKLKTIPKENQLEFGIYCAVLGNVIDYGAEYAFDLEAECQKIFDTRFAYFHINVLKQQLQKAKKIIYIGDNAGENELDEVLIQILKAHYPQLQIFYFVRGAEIINDITLDDLHQSDSELFRICEVRDSGVPSPGFIYELASIESQRLFREADLVFAKGMGNFESLEKQAQDDSRIFFLFKIKCNVVADYLNQKLGEFVLLHSHSLKKD
ncbi:ARMT1-like domain-containing protein [Helicobacter colisuis]|uniref:Damage-control phosphatase ARMT1 family protein n=1 Tax=Helicobacter colisuis TaxID=2949739 RepID=A0ABT0TTB5_9HELI|nr:damage-control phosphatase ARMT1 family protein [Helicobacter colisuis]